MVNTSELLENVVKGNELKVLMSSAKKARERESRLTHPAFAEQVSPAERQDLTHSDS